MSRGSVCVIQGANHTLVYKNRYEELSRPCGQFAILEIGSLVNGNDVVLNRVFPPNTCITAGAYIHHSNIFLLVGYRVDSGAVHALALDAYHAPNASMSNFVLHVSPFRTFTGHPSQQQDRMVWIVDPVPNLQIENGNIVLDIIIERCDSEEQGERILSDPIPQRIAQMRRPAPRTVRNYSATQHRLVFPPRKRIFDNHDRSVPSGIIVLDSGLESRNSYSSVFYTTMTHWTKQVLNANMGMVCSLSSIGPNFDPDNPEEPEFRSTTGAARPFMIRFPAHTPRSTERALMSRHYIRHKSRFMLESEGTMRTRLSVITEWTNFEGRRMLSVGLDVVTVDPERGRLIVTACRLPESMRVTHKEEADLRIATSTSVQIRVAEGEQEIIGMGAAMERIISTTWITDEWVIVEKEGERLETYFIQDTTKNAMAFVYSTCQKDSLFHQLNTGLVTDILDEIVRVDMKRKRVE